MAGSAREKLAKLAPFGLCFRLISLSSPRDGMSILDLPAGIPEDAETRRFAVWRNSDCGSERVRWSALNRFRRRDERTALSNPALQRLPGSKAVITHASWQL